MSSTEGFVERVVHGVERRIEEWREQDKRRRVEVEANRRQLWEEAVERERLLAGAVREEEAGGVSPGEARDKRVVFVMHSEEAGKALGEFCAGRTRLADVVPVRSHHDRDSGLKGSWLVFESS